jgi:oxygen-dependent protoporphyrinogen oxidase
VTVVAAIGRGAIATTLRFRRPIIPTMKEVLVIGGGISGLATAHAIATAAERGRCSVRTTVLESSARPGGRVWTERLDGFQVELGATSFLDSKASTVELCRSTGLADELVRARPEASHRYIAHGDRLHALPGSLVGFLGSGLLSWSGKARLLCERWIRPRHETSDESIDEFARRRVGREASEVLVDAMVTGIHAGDPRLLSVGAAFPRLVQLEREHRSLFRAMAAVRRERARESTEPPQQSGGPGGTPWSLKRGMGQLIEQLSRDPRWTLICESPARRIEAGADGRWNVQGDGERRQADAVVLACPSFAQAELVATADAELARLLAEIPYNSVTVVALGFRVSDIAMPLDGFGYLIPQRSRNDLLGVLWNSSIFDGRSPSGMVLMQAMCGGWHRPDIVAWDDERLVRAVLGELRNRMGITATPPFVHITRWQQAIPQYHMGHIDRVRAIESRRSAWRGLFLTGNSLRGISVNDCTENAVAVGAQVVNYLAGLDRL